ncbi:hypothetical protein D9M68_739410 [compost metagenome]
MLWIKGSLSACTIGLSLSFAAMMRRIITRSEWMIGRPTASRMKETEPAVSRSRARKSVIVSRMTSAPMTISGLPRCACEIVMPSVSVVALS